MFFLNPNYKLKIIHMHLINKSKITYANKFTKKY